MKLAIMQPYLFPYVGYFQLINAVDEFVFYDDVNFIKKGFINRNYILHKDERWSFTLSCKKISQNKKINETEVNFNYDERVKLINTIKQSYKSAPFYNSVFPLLHDFFLNNSKSYISNIAIDSILLVSNYLNLNTTFYTSSKKFSYNRDLQREHRLIDICKHMEASVYINPIGGTDLYKKKDFELEGLSLKFLDSESVKYSQFQDNFVSNLSIIDILMFNSVEETKWLLSKFRLL